MNKPARDKKGRLLPGSTANPNGRLPNEDSWADAIRKVMASKEVEILLTNETGKEKRYHAVSHKGTIKSAIIGMMTAKALAGDLKAADMLIDRDVGKPSQHVKVDTVDINPLLEKLKDNEENTVIVDSD